MYPGSDLRLGSASWGTYSNKLPVETPEVKDPRFRVPSAIPSKAEVEVHREERRNLGSGTARKCPLPVETLEPRRLAASVNAAPVSDDETIPLERRLWSVLVLSCVLIVEPLKKYFLFYFIFNSKLISSKSQSDGFGQGSGRERVREK